jgi:FlaA1/EpsC-like NDP-sugar epimerase
MEKSQARLQPINSKRLHEEEENTNVRNVWDIDIEKLLGRKQIILENDEIENYIRNKVVMVTGGGAPSDPSYVAR